MSRSEYEKRSCNIRHDHPSHLWIPRRGQCARCPGIGGSTGIVRVDTNDKALVNRVAGAIWWEAWGELGAAPTFALLSDEERDLPLRQARAVLAALREES